MDYLYFPIFPLHEGQTSIIVLCTPAVLDVRLNPEEVRYVPIAVVSDPEFFCTHMPVAKRQFSAFCSFLFNQSFHGLNIGVL